LELHLGFVEQAWNILWELDCFAEGWGDNDNKLGGGGHRRGFFWRFEGKMSSPSVLKAMEATLGSCLGGTLTVVAY
jgi:hypothetical protein